MQPGLGSRYIFAHYYNLFSVEELLDFIRAKQEEVELIITGKKTDSRIIEEADLVAEMKEIKHYYQKGVQARDGIEKQGMKKDDVRRI